MDEAEYVVKRHGSIIYGPCGHDEARMAAGSLNADYHTDEYRVEEFDFSRIKL